MEKLIEKNTSKKRYTLTLESDRALLQVPRKETRKRLETKGSWFYLGLVGDIGYAIALPMVGGALLGGYIDRKLSIYPKATLLGIGAGIIISISGLVRILGDLSSKKD